MDSFAQGSVSANGLSFPYLERGSGPLFLCLHGFPDTPRSFRYQLEAFSRAGYRVVAPYMRGYAETNLKGPYQAAAFGRDAVAIIESLGYDEAVVYGHDWGTSAAYAASLLAPHRVKRLIAAAVPYGPGLRRAFATNPRQQRRSWYVFFFQTRIANSAVPVNDFAFIDALYRDWSPTHEIPAEELAHVKATLAETGVLDAALEYYRASFSRALHEPALESEQARFGVAPIAVPTLYVHGEADECIGVEVTEGMESLFTAGFSRIVVPGAGHFVHQEAPEAFNRAVLDFLEP